MDGTLGEFDALSIDFRQPHRPPIFHESGLDDNTIRFPTAQVPLGIPIVINPVAMHRPE
jgi:hypothetical protein